jgi:putative transcriptional regulator
MPIITNIDVMLARRKMSSGELAEKVGITPANLSILKCGKAKAIRLSTMEAICKALDCQPGDLLEYQPEDLQRKSPTPQNVGLFLYLCKV